MLNLQHIIVLTTHAGDAMLPAGMSLAKMFGVVAIGMPLTLLTTAQVAFLVRKYVKTEMLDAPTADALPPFGRLHFITWGQLLCACHLVLSTSSCS